MLHRQKSKPINKGDQYYDYANDVIIELDETLEFSSDMIVGNAAVPFVLNGVFTDGNDDGGDDGGAAESCGDQSTWSVNPADYQYNGSVTSKVFLNDNEVGAEDDMLAAFVGDEIRGVINGLAVPPFLGGGYSFNIMIFSNEAGGEMVEFKFYQASSNTVVCLNETIEFTSDMIIGSAISPFVFTGDIIEGEDIFGCTDGSACNYNGDATIDDDSCEYPSGCDNTCGSDLVDDACEVCGGSCGLSCESHDDCFGENSVGPNWCYSNGDGDAYCVQSDWDFCVNNDCYEGDGDCDCGGDCSVPGADQEECVGNLECVQYADDGGLGTDIDICACTVGYDCAGECGGNAIEDCTGACGGSAEADCAGVCGGESVLSGCDNACNSTAVEDCAGECGGDSVLSGCDNACGSTATVDECGECGGSGIAANSSIRANDEYVASTGFGLGDYEVSYQDIEGFVIANTFQLNLEYQPGVDSDAVDVFNNYGEGTVHNWMDPEYYVVTISEEGGLPAWSYSDAEEDEDAGEQDAEEADFENADLRSKRLDGGIAHGKGRISEQTEQKTLLHLNVPKHRPQCKASPGRVERDPEALLGTDSLADLILTLWLDPATYECKLQKRQKCAISPHRCNRWQGAANLSRHGHHITVMERGQPVLIVALGDGHEGG